MTLGASCLVSFHLMKSYRNFDIAMKAIQNGKERDIDDWAQLFSAVDPCLKFRGAKQPPGSALSIIDAVWDP